MQERFCAKQFLQPNNLVEVGWSFKYSNIYSNKCFDILDTYQITLTSGILNYFFLYYAKHQNTHLNN